MTEPSSTSAENHVHLEVASVRPEPDQVCAYAQALERAAQPPRWNRAGWGGKSLFCCPVGGYSYSQNSAAVGGCPLIALVGAHPFPPEGNGHDPTANGSEGSSSAGTGSRRNVQPLGTLMEMPSTVCWLGAP